MNQRTAKLLRLHFTHVGGEHAHKRSFKGMKRWYNSIPRDRRFNLKAMLVEDINNKATVEGMKQYI
jgi:hypothetical protein